MSETVYGAIEAHTIETPTPELRFVIRGTEKVLQQKYTLMRYTKEKPEGVDVEWRDVPTVVEPEEGKL